MSLIKNTTWSAFSAILLSGGRFLLSMLLARKLGIEDFGRFAFFQWLMDMAVMFFSFGLSGSASRYFAEFKGEPERLRAFEQWFLPRAIWLVSLVFFVFPLAISAFGYDLTPINLALLAAWAAAALALGMLNARAQGLMRFKRLAISNLLYVIIAIVGFMLLPERSDALISIVLVIVVATVVAAAALWSPLPYAKPDIRIELPTDARGSLRKFALNVWITSLVAAFVWSRGETAVVQSMLGAKDVGLYAVAVTLVGLAVQGTMLLTGAVGPHLTQIWAAGKLQEAQSFCRSFTNVLTLSAAILAAFLILFGTEIVFFAYGSQFQDADRILPVLVFGIFGLASSAANQLLLIKTNGVYGRNSNLLGSLCLFGLAFPLTLSFGTEGAAASRVVVQVGLGAAALYLVSRLVSSDAVSWMIQVKAFVLVPLLFVLQTLGPFSLYSRLSQFVLFSLMAVILLTEQQDRKKIRFVARAIFP